MTGRKSWMILWLSLLLCAEGRTETLTLAECLKRSSTKSIQVLQAELAERQAKAGLSEAKAKRLPQLLGVGAIDQSDDVSRQLEGSNMGVVRLEQAVTPLSADWVRTQQQAAAVEAAALGRLESKADVELAVKQLYFAILNAEAALKSMSSVEGELARLRDAVLPRFTVGRIAAFDLVKAKTAIADLARARALVEAERAAKSAELAQLIGEGPQAALELGPVSAAPEAPEAARVKEALPDNPTLRALDRQAYAEELGIKAAKRSRLPDLVTGVEYGESGTAARNMTPGWDVTVGLRLPLYDWGIISARVDQQKASAALSRGRLELERQKVNAELVAVQAAAGAHLADQKRLVELLPETRKAAAASIDQYRRGAVGILEAADALNLWLQTLLNERSAYHAYLSDVARLERLSGGKLKIDYGD